MSVKVHQIEVDINYINPTLALSLNVEYYYSLEFPVSIAGSLKTSDGKIIAPLLETQILLETPMRLNFHTKKSLEKLFNEGGRNKHSYNTKLNAALDTKAIAHIERLREMHPEKAVEFRFEFVLKYCEFSTEIENLPIDKPVHFLTYQVKKVYDGISISQSDWINKYSEKLGIGKFLLLELELPNKANVPENWVKLYERVFLRLEEIQNEIRKGEWEKAITKGRLFFENLRFSEKDDFKGELKELFIQYQHTEKGFECFFNIIIELFGYTSKFLHDKSKEGELNSVPIATKGTAYFVFAAATGLLNEVGEKLSRTVN